MPQLRKLHGPNCDILPQVRRDGHLQDHRHHDRRDYCDHLDDACGRGVARCPMNIPREKPCIHVRARYLDWRDDSETFQSPPLVLAHPLSSQTSGCGNEGRRLDNPNQTTRLRAVASEAAHGRSRQPGPGSSTGRTRQIGVKTRGPNPYRAPGNARSQSSSRSRWPRQNGESWRPKRSPIVTETLHGPL